jgi:antitoxin component of MazEF toxin-antitoxin module
MRRPKLGKVRAISSLRGNEGNVVIEGPSNREAFIRRDERIEELVNGITSKNRHAATKWGKSQGKEIW